MCGWDERRQMRGRATRDGNRTWMDSQSAETPSHFSAEYCPIVSSAWEEGGLARTQVHVAHCRWKRRSEDHRRSRLDIRGLEKRRQGGKKKRK